MHRAKSHIARLDTADERGTTLQVPAPVALPLRLEWRDPAELADNPANWRRHPQAQLRALTDVLAEVGWAGALLFNEATGRLIDGHARKEVSPCGKVPVLIGSWTEEQEKKILATLDPLAAMAEADRGQLETLLREVQTESVNVAQMLSDLAVEHGIVASWATRPSSSVCVRPLRRRRTECPTTTIWPRPSKRRPLTRC
jgi:hypothetical protein